MKAKLLTAAILSSVVAVTSFWVGRLSARTNGRPAPAACDDPPVAPIAKRDSHHTLPAGAPTITICPPTSDNDPAALAEARRKRAEFLLSGVFTQLADQSHMGIDVAEARATAVLPYLSGMLRGALQADPGIRSAFSAEFTASLCDRTLEDDQMISMAHMALGLPDVATESGFDCFFSKAKEGVPLWTMLDAWRRSGLPKTPALARLQATATDSRTTRRFLTNEEALAQRRASALSTEPER